MYALSRCPKCGTTRALRTPKTPLREALAEREQLFAMLKRIATGVSHEYIPGTGTLSYVMPILESMLSGDHVLTVRLNAADSAMLRDLQHRIEFATVLGEQRCMPYATPVPEPMLGPKEG